MLWLTGNHFFKTIFLFRTFYIEDNLFSMSDWRVHLWIFLAFFKELWRRLDRHMRNISIFLCLMRQLICILPCLRGIVSGAMDPTFGFGCIGEWLFLIFDDINSICGDFQLWTRFKGCVLRVWCFSKMLSMQKPIRNSTGLLSPRLYFIYWVFTLSKLHFISPLSLFIDDNGYYSPIYQSAYHIIVEWFNLTNNIELIAIKMIQ